jgi:hypothetical protein
MKTTALPQWCCDIISTPPHTGEGFHLWLFRAARALWRCGRRENDIREILESAASTCGRYVPERELEEAVRNSQVSAFQPPSFTPPRPWPPLNREQREAAIQETQFGLVDLWESSPIRFDDNKSKTEELIDRLFPGNPLLCCGKTQAAFDTKPRAQWRGELSRQQFIVPSPMMKWVGTTKAGKESAHCLDATGPRRFLVVEQDVGSIDEQAAVLWHLAFRAPLALVVHSGSESLHAWFYCAGQDEEKVLRPFFRYATSLGADTATWTPSQFVRLPDGTRGDGSRQAVYYFRPEVMK